MQRASEDQVATLEDAACAFIESANENKGNPLAILRQMGRYMEALRSLQGKDLASIDFLPVNVFTPRSHLEELILSSQDVFFQLRNLPWMSRVPVPHPESSGRVPSSCHLSGSASRAPSATNSARNSLEETRSTNMPHDSLSTVPSAHETTKQDTSETARDGRPPYPTNDHIQRFLGMLQVFLQAHKRNLARASEATKGKKTYNPILGETLHWEIPHDPSAESPPRVLRYNF